ncbi:hypothetical protein [Streptomyces sp. NPDC050560]|uniref:hypothetical protein n=1 Tax=Streptomyces sp. NPDC050560 TaxID=3365630 RepID=UPI00378E10B8
MSAEQTEEPQTAASEPRPGRLTLAAGLAALEGTAVFAAGCYLLVRGLGGGSGDRQGSVTTGVTLLVLAALPLFAALGLLRLRRWSRGPAVITQVLALPVAYNLLQADSGLIPVGIVVAVVAVAALVLLLNPATARALGIRRPGDSA